MTRTRRAWAQFVVQRAEAYFTDAKRGQERSAALTELLTTSRASRFVIPGAAVKEKGGEGTPEGEGAGTPEGKGTLGKGTPGKGTSGAGTSGAGTTAALEGEGEGGRRALLEVTPGRSTILEKELPPNLSQEEGVAQAVAGSKGGTGGKEGGKVGRKVGRKRGDKRGSKGGESGEGGEGGEGGEQGGEQGGEH